MPKSKTMKDKEKEEKQEGDHHAEDVLKEIKEDNIQAARKQRSKYNKTATTAESTNSDQKPPAK
jgi:hypothetical protein